MLGTQNVIIFFAKRTCVLSCFKSQKNDPYRKKTIYNCSDKNLSKTEIFSKNIKAKIPRTEIRFRFRDVYTIFVGIMDFLCLRPNFVIHRLQFLLAVQ